MANTATLKSADPQIHRPAAAAVPLRPLAYAMLSHCGLVRRTNQDACAALPEHAAFVLCDGMGGAAGGEIASHLATDAFLHAISGQPHGRRIPPKSARTAATAPTDHPAGHPHTRLTDAVCAANQAVFRQARKSPRLRGMGTTLVAALFEPDAATLWLAHVGDSRCYRLRRGILQQLTEDHSLVEEQIRAGLLSRVAAVASPVRNIITRAIGSQPAVEAEIAAHSIQPGDLYLLASDGLTRELTDAEIRHILLRTVAPTLDSACQALIDQANNRGGHDNITVLLIACP